MFNFQVYCLYLLPFIVFSFHFLLCYCFPLIRFIVLKILV